MNYEGCRIKIPFPIQWNTFHWDKSCDLENLSYTHYECLPVYATHSSSLISHHALAFPFRID